MKVSKGRVSYYVAGNNRGDGAHPLRHSLGVNALILDPLDRYLFSAGRDGVVAAWKLDLDPNSVLPRFLSSSLTPSLDRHLSSIKQSIYTLTGSMI